MTIRHAVARALLFAVACAPAACRRPDGQILAEVEARVALDPMSAPLDVSVQVRDGNVYLSGTTTTRAQQAQVVAATRSVDGADRVFNQLRIDDEVIAAGVRRALAGEPLLAGIPIAVDVNESVVRLTSDQTGPEHRQRAVQLAAAVDGVTRVEDWMS